MANVLIQEPIRTEYGDGTVVYSNIRRKRDNISTTYTKVTTWYDGTLMDDSKVDAFGTFSKVRENGEYIRENLPNWGENFLEVDTVPQFRSLDPYYLHLIKVRYFKGIKLNGYTEKGDTPQPIEYFLSNHPMADNGFDMFEVGGLKFYHNFNRKADIRYAGAKSGSNIKEMFQIIESKVDHVILDDYYESPTDLKVTTDNKRIEITPRGFLHVKNSSGVTNTNGITIDPNLRSVTVLGGGTVKGFTTAETVGYAIAFNRDTSRINVSDITMEGFTGGIMLNYRNRQATFTGNKFYDMKFVPSVSAGGYGIVYQESYDTITTGNYFDETVERHGVYYAVNTALSTRAGENHVLSDNIFKMTNKTAYLTGFEFSVKIMAVKNLTCTGNIVQGGVGGIWITSYSPIDGSDTIVIDCENINVTGNSINGVRKGNSGYACAIGSHGAFSKIYDLNVSDNVITDCECGRADIDLGRVIRGKIHNNMISGKAGTQFGVLIDITAIDLSVTDNNISGHLRGFFLRKNSTHLEGLKPKNIKLSGNSIKAVNYGVFHNHPDFEDNFDVSDNTIVTESGSSVNIQEKTKGLRICNNSFSTPSSSALIILGSGQTEDSFIYGNTYRNANNRQNAISNSGTGYILQPLGDRNVTCRLADVPTDTSRYWVVGDTITPVNPVNSTWVRVTNGFNNVKGTDWVLQRPAATPTTFGVVKQGAFIADSATTEQLIQNLKVSGAIKPTE